MSDWRWWAREAGRYVFRMALLCALFSAAGGMDITTRWVRR